MDQRTADLPHLMDNNRAWAARMTDVDPDFFRRLTAQQKPEYLWIGCSDSRVPANEIIGLLPGELFVHRNVANLVIHTDLNCLSVLQYAVEVLEVRHVIVCGHYGCGGITTAVEDQPSGLIYSWLGHVRDLYRIHAAEIDALTDRTARLNRLCEINVVAQVRHVAQTAIVQEAWRRGQPLAIHGWIYDIHDGLLQDLHVTAEGADEVR
jgi:carbonic anhydrase